jgi:hypothetical protein
MGYELAPVFPVITMLPSVPRYLMRSRHKSVTLFVCKLLPLPTNEFTFVPFAIIASITTLDIDHNDRVTVNFSTDTFVSSFPEMIFVYWIHLTLGINPHYDVDRQRCQLITMDHGPPSYILSQWKSRLRSAYILSIDTVSIHTIANVILIISEARLANKHVIVAFTKDDALSCLLVVGFTQLYFDQLRITKGHIDSTVLTVFHKAIPGPKFNRRTLHKQLYWKYWTTAEWIQLDNYDKQLMF